MSEPHAIRRARERYGLTLTESDLRIIAARIRTGLSVLVRRDATAEVHMVKVQETVIQVMYGVGDGSIITVLPPTGRWHGLTAQQRRRRQRAVQP